MEQQTDATGTLDFPVQTNVRAAQSFVPTANFTATRIAAFLQDVGRSDDLTLTLVPDAGGQPATMTILGSGTNNTNSAFEWANFTLTPSVAVTAGTTYWIVADDNAGSGEGYAWRYEATDAYPRGNASTATGATWTAQPGDFAFVVYGWIPAAVGLTVTADRTTVVGGEGVRYTIRVTNGGTEDATAVWVNATLDSRLRFASAGPGPVVFAGSVVTFNPSAIPTGTTLLFLNATASGIVQDNASLIVPVTVEFWDGAARDALATASIVRTRAPDVVARVALAESYADPGAVLAFDVTLTNRGNATAGHVWLNETLHRTLTYLNDTAPAPPTFDNAQQSWHFLDVVPGTQRFRVTVQLDPLATGDTIVTNFLSVDFTDPTGEGLVRGKSNTVWFRVIGPSAGTGGSNPWLWGSFAISATIVGGTYLAYARRRLRTEEIFLIHHSGVLLVHMSKTMKADHDSDILSGMFTAVMNFVRDAFHYESEQELRGLDLGKFRVHVRKGASTYLALVYTGKMTRWLQQTAARAVADIESKYGEMLRDWDGDVRALTGVREILRGYFLSPTGPSQSMTSLRAALSGRAQTFKPARPF